MAEDGAFINNDILDKIREIRNIFFPILFHGTDEWDVLWIHKPNLDTCIEFIDVWFIKHAHYNRKLNSPRQLRMMLL